MYLTLLTILYRTPDESGNASRMEYSAYLGAVQREMHIEGVHKVKVVNYFELRDELRFQEKL